VRICDSLNRIWDEPIALSPRPVDPQVSESASVRHIQPVALYELDDAIFKHLQQVHEVVLADGHSIRSFVGRPVADLHERLLCQESLDVGVLSEGVPECLEDLAESDLWCLLHCFPDLDRMAGSERDALVHSVYEASGVVRRLVPVSLVLWPTLRQIDRKIVVLLQQLFDILLVLALLLTQPMEVCGKVPDVVVSRVRNCPVLNDLQDALSHVAHREIAEESLQHLLETVWHQLSH
jgi:hypothetical protein